MKITKSMKPTKQATPVNWRDIHSRLESARTVIEQGWAPGPQEKKKILKARAQLLAQEPKQKSESEDVIEVVEFALANEKYGIESAYVSEVYPLKELTPLPCTPPFVLGIINVRGQILSVVNIKIFFDLPEKGLTDLNKVIIIHSGSMEYGILADMIIGARNVSTSELQPSLPTLTGIREEYLKGITKDQVVILDAEKLLSDRKIIVHEQVAV